MSSWTLLLPTWSRGQAFLPFVWIFSPLRIARSIARTIASPKKVENLFWGKKTPFRRRRYVVAQGFLTSEDWLLNVHGSPPWHQRKGSGFVTTRITHVSNDAPLALEPPHIVHMIYIVQDMNGSMWPKEAFAPLPDMSEFAARGSKHCSAFLFQLTTGKLLNQTGRQRPLSEEWLLQVHGCPLWHQHRYLRKLESEMTRHWHLHSLHISRSKRQKEALECSSKLLSPYCSARGYLHLADFSNSCRGFLSSQRCFGSLGISTHVHIFHITLSRILL